METYFPPKFHADEFNCPHCQVYAAQLWGSATCSPYGDVRGLTVEDYVFCKCGKCRKWSCWHNGLMIMPGAAPVPLAHAYMPKACKAVYDEARAIVGLSPKAGAALIRLTLQLLMKEIGEKGKEINDDIQSLVDKGLDIHIQEALDYCRVVGNQAVHPGEIQLDEQPEVAHILFEMINAIVEDRIARPAKIKAAVHRLPEGARMKIEARVAKTKGAP